MAIFFFFGARRRKRRRSSQGTSRGGGCGGPASACLRSLNISDSKSQFFADLLDESISLRMKGYVLRNGLYIGLIISRVPMVPSCRGDVRFVPSIPSRPYFFFFRLVNSEVEKIIFFCAIKLCIYVYSIYMIYVYIYMNYPYTKRKQYSMRVNHFQQIFCRA